jgi:hypothetical protein
METKKSSPRGIYALVIGIVAGFAVLALIFNTLDGNAADTNTMTGVAIVASLISVFVATLAPYKPKSCETDSTTVK